MLVKSAELLDRFFVTRDCMGTQTVTMTFRFAVAYVPSSTQLICARLLVAINFTWIALTLVLPWLDNQQLPYDGEAIQLLSL
jgi:hypothetical protein